MTFPLVAGVTPDENTSTGTTTHNFDLPATVNAGDRLLLSATIGHASAAPTSTLDSWTLIEDVSAHSFHRWYVYEVEAVTSDPGAGQALASALANGSVSFTTSAGNSSSSAVTRVTGAGSGSAARAASTAPTPTYDNEPDPPALDPPWSAEDTLYLTVVISESREVSAAPPGYLDEGGTTVAGGQNFITRVASDEITATSDDPGVWTLASAGWSSAITVAYRAGAAGATADLPLELALAATGEAPPVDAADADLPIGLALAAVGQSPGFVPAAQFPRARLDIGLELEIDGAWTDVTDRLIGRASDLVIPLTWGRADETSRTQPGRTQVQLDNGDGWLTPADPRSPWWPHIDRGMKMRVSVPGATTALVLDGDDSFVSTPDHPDFDFSGPFDLRILVEPDQWSHGLTWVGGQLSFGTPQRLMARWDPTSGEASWNWTTWGPGWPALEWSTDGTATAGFAYSERTIAEIRPTWQAATFSPDVDGSYEVAWWRWGRPGTPPADVTDWDLIDRVTGTATAAAHTGGGQVTIGAIAGATGDLAGRVLAAEIRDGINGTVVASPDFRALPTSTTTFVDSSGKQWTMQGNAGISRRRTRLVTQADAITPLWPYGDHARGSAVRPSEARVVITASDLLRRIGRSRAPTESVLRRHILSPRFAGRIHAYWPCEVDKTAIRYGAAWPPGGPSIRQLGWDPAADSTLAPSGPLPSIAEGDYGRLDGYVTNTDVADDSWGIDVLYRLETPPTSPTQAVLIRAAAGATIINWQLAINDTDVAVTAVNGDHTLVVNSTTAVDAGMFNAWCIARLIVTQDGANIDWTWRITSLATGVTWTASGSLAGTLTALTRFHSEVIGPPDGMSLGHVVVHDGTLAENWLAGADTAWTAESAGHRFFRLCDEAGVGAEVHGDPSVFSDFRGDLLFSQAMGPQEMGQLLDLLEDAVAVDLGILIPRRRSPGLVYRTRRSLESQPVRLALDAAQAHIENPFTPAVDDQRLRNEVTVKSPGGTQATATDAASVAAVGLHDTSVEIAGVGGIVVQDAILLAQDGAAEAVAHQLHHQATWRLHMGTWPGMRYPELSIELVVASDLIDTWLGIEVGDRVTVANLPAQHPVSLVDLLIERIDERLTPTTWSVSLTCSPAGIWEIGVLDE